MFLLIVDDDLVIGTYDLLMTDEEYMQQVIKEWERIDDDLPKLSDDF
jgi:hypothetical protein